MKFFMLFKGTRLSSVDCFSHSEFGSTRSVEMIFKYTAAKLFCCGTASIGSSLAFTVPINSPPSASL